MSPCDPAARRPDLWLVRHGETDWSASGRHTGRTDIPLTDEGIRQARALGRHLDGRSFSLVLTSPLSRAADTCGLAGYGEVPSLRGSPRMGLWPGGGRTTIEMRAQHPGWSVWTTGPPGGETVDEVGRRTERVIARALEASGRRRPLRPCPRATHPRGAVAGLPPDAGRLLRPGAGLAERAGWGAEARVISRWNDRSFLG